MPTTQAKLFYLRLLVELQGHAQVVEGRGVDALLHEVFTLLEIHRVTGGSGLSLTGEEGEARLVDGLLEVAPRAPKGDGDTSVRVYVPEIESAV